MKSTITTLLIACFTICLLHGQEKKPLSPPMSTSGTIGDASITIDYNAPSMRGRTLWGDLVPFGRVWRTGANSATKISFDKDIIINDQPLAAGTYAVFTIPDEKVWTVIFNTESSQWGAFNYDESKDALRVEAVPQTSEEVNETMVFKIADDQLYFGWDKLRLSLSLGQ